MIPMQVLSLKHDVGDDSKDTKADTFLDNLKLHKIKWTAIAHKSHTVGRHLAAILKECYSPRERNHTEQRPLGGNTRFLEFQVPIPSKRHEDVA